MIKRHSDDDLSNNALDWTQGALASLRTTHITSIRKLIHPRVLPEVESLSDMEIIGLLNEIEFDLMQSQIQVDFLDRLPARMAYTGILQMLDSPLALDSSAFMVQHIDGCDSACESCFQLSRCPVARKVLGPDWTMAVRQSHINPSWSALFAKEDTQEDAQEEET